MADISQTQFCQVLSKLRTQLDTRSSAVDAASYGLRRLAGTIALAQRGLVDAAESAVAPPVFSLPADTNLYTQLIALCPGLLPPLPADAERAVLAVSALQALVSAQSPGQMLNSIVGDPLGRLQRVQSTLLGVVNQMKSIVSAPAGGFGIPGSLGGVTKLAAGLIANEAKVFATRAIADALDKAGIDPNAANRCAGRLCATGSAWVPPG